MDWQTIIASITASSVIMAAIGYLLKVSLDKTLELKIEKLKEQNKSDIQENIRRQSLLYDIQFENLKLLLSLIYRLRNLTRDIIKNLEQDNGEELNELLNSFSNSENTLIDLLYKERAILPEFLFGYLHELKSSLSAINHNILSITRYRNAHKKARKTDESIKIEAIKGSFKKIDEMYIILTDEVHKYIGTNSIQKNQTVEFIKQDK